MDYLEVAKSLERQGKIKQSAVYYVKAYDKIGDAHLALKAGELYCSIGSFKQAGTVFGLVSGRADSLIYEKIVDICFKNGNYSGAIEYFSLYFSTCPRIKKLQFANTLFNHGLYLDAELWYASCIPAKTQKRASRYQINTDYQIVNCLPHFAAKNVSRANTLFDEGEYKRAQRRYLRDFRRTAYCKIRIAECHLELGSFERARRIYRSLFRETQNGYYAFMVGECFKLEGNGCESQAFYWYDLALKNDCVYSNYALGNCYQNGIGVQPNPQIAKEFYLKGVNCLKDSELSCLALASLCHKNGDLKGANDYYKRVFKSEDHEALCQLVLHHYKGLAGLLSKQELLCCLAKSAAYGNDLAIKLYCELKNSN